MIAYQWWRICTHIRRQSIVALCHSIIFRGRPVGLFDAVQRIILCFQISCRIFRTIIIVFGCQLTSGRWLTVPEWWIIQCKKLAYKHQQNSSREYPVQFSDSRSPHQKEQIYHKKGTDLCSNFIIYFDIFEAVYKYHHCCIDNGRKRTAAQYRFFVFLAENILQEKSNGKRFYKTDHKAPAMWVFGKYKHTAGKRHHNQKYHQRSQKNRLYPGRFFYKKIADCKNCQNADCQYDALIIIEISGIIFIDTKHLIGKKSGKNCSQCFSLIWMKQTWSTSSAHCTCTRTFKECICNRHKSDPADQCTEYSHSPKTNHFSCCRLDGAFLHYAVYNYIKYSKKSNHIEEIITCKQ